MDQMTAVERYKAIQAGQPIDRAPVILYDNLIAAKLVGMTYQESEASAEALAKKMLASYQRFGHDAVSLIYSTKNFTRLLGTEVKLAENAPASVSRYALTQVSDMDQLDFQAVNRETDKGRQKVYEAVQMIQEETEGQVFCRIHMPAPFTAAAGLLAPEQLLRATRKEKAAVHELLDRVTGLLKEIVADFSKLDHIYISLSDPVASGSLISPRIYREFAKEATKDLVADIHAHNLHVALHICGQTQKILEDIAEIGVDAFSLDQVVDLQQAKDSVGGRLLLQGNIAPVDEFWHGSPESISHAVQAAYELMGCDPKEFILAPGCDLPLETPLENVDAYMAAARRFSVVN
ncbi:MULTISPECIES: uroporphyrinogen decarboxylase family protein [Aerococcus]|nr:MULTISPECIES: uroporphyrinogen decarboxylase family protein [Aerococcus]MDK6370064.1 uroporphyrinogen decarboxylase family protein [Aerococcus sp. UMB9870]MDK6680670.1 uroporphyrinogen decarboxylase family protein [Aerococcus sp. UMB8608]MDK6687463.1 uroporphyrinogen decarboxylase family protein [Aerococcus sp. UMB8623]MDK6940620.1 uroporphyrinogen decarboxylase family protein [Aerococcus sp. UMB8487]OFK20521.1 hypothetical protein HMPREF2829_03960 [Aerococcus sp. HMSC072A12]